MTMHLAASGARIWLGPALGGTITYMTVEDDATAAEVFRAIAQEVLIPMLKPRAVVILDNFSFKKFRSHMVEQRVPMSGFCLRIFL
jgi:hypothetical protein